MDKSEFQTGALASQLQNSRSMSAKNAWGTSTGYADQLMNTKPGMDAARAQQLENWHQQREIQAQKQQQKYMTEQYDQVNQNAEADWRTLAKFGVERNQVSVKTHHIPLLVSLMIGCGVLILTDF